MFFLLDIFKNLFCFTGSYSVTSFLDPLSLEDVEMIMYDRIVFGDEEVSVQACYEDHCRSSAGN